MSGPLIGNSSAFREVTDAIAMVAPVDSSVLLLGETGTGKEVFARAIHDAGPRRDRRFVAVNCGAAIPLGLLESELFGHERGAFTGAVSQSVGRFQLADRGSSASDARRRFNTSAPAGVIRYTRASRDRLGSVARSHPRRAIRASNGYNVPGLSR